MSEQKVATEVAEAEFVRFAEAMDLDIDTAKMDGEDRKGFEQKKQGNNATKLFVAMGEMTGQGMPFFSKLPQRDLRVCTRLANLFFS